MSAAARIAVVLLLAAPGVALAQLDLSVALSPSAAPIANAVTHATPSSVSFDVTNSRAGTQVTQIDFQLPWNYTIQDGHGPPGWTVTNIVNFFGMAYIRLRAADCGQGLPANATGRFRFDVTPPSGSLRDDTTDPLQDITPSDYCGGNGGWTVTSASSIRIPRKVLRVTGTVTPAQGPSPLTATATWTVTNLSSSRKNGIALQPMVTPAAAGSCTPATVSLSSGRSADVTCTYSLSDAATYAFGATAIGPSASAVGSWAGSVVVGGATATFAFDALQAGRGDVVKATLTVQNQAGGAITVNPPDYSELELTNLTPVPGALDPAESTLAAGGSGAFIYSFVVDGPVGGSYTAQGTASTTVGTTNLAVTPAGTVSASSVSWSPPAIVEGRTAAPYAFTVSVSNGSSSAVSVEIMNPQNGTWTGMARVSETGATYDTSSTNGGTTTLRYTGLAAGGTATLQIQFDSVPDVTATTTYPFQVRVTTSGWFSYSTTYEDEVALAVPPPDVSKLTILSNAEGQVLSWVNAGRTDAPHDGVVVFRTAGSTAPPIPADFVDYADPANQTAEVLYADRDGSPVDTFVDPSVGSYRYRVCNHDALFVYSNCNSGLSEGAGWLDSAIAPAGGWTHQLGGTALLLPGVVPGNRVGIATNTPYIAVLDLATGARTFDPVTLSSLPSTKTPAARLGNGRLVLFGADNGGGVTAIDLETGAEYWRVTKAGATFVAGVAGILRQYAAAAFQAAYPMDVLLLGSTQGTVYAIDATNGSTLWTVSAGAGVRALITYDAALNRFYVPTVSGVAAFDLGGSSTSVAAAPAAGWQPPPGSYRHYCVRTGSAANIACVDSVGVLRVLDKGTGAIQASLSTGVTSPSSLWRVGGSSPGFVVSSASRVKRILAGATLSEVGEWAPSGVTLAPVQVFESRGTIIAAASDGQLHKLRLADAGHSGEAAAVTSPGVVLGSIGYDVGNQLFVFGTDTGRVWAVPSF